MQPGRFPAVKQAQRVKHGAVLHPRLGPFLSAGTPRFGAWKGFGTNALGNSRPASGQKDVTAELLERAFALALTTRLKQHSSIDVDVRSTAWGLMEGKFGGMTVSGKNWRTPLELTAEQLMVDVGELILDYQKLVWQQTVALKNVPQGSVAFTLTSQDLANFMVHPIMVAAAARAVKGHAFIFDKNTASVQLDRGTGRGVITYQGTWAGDGQRYAVTMCTLPPSAAARPAAAAAAPVDARAGAAGGVASVAASFNTLEQLTVSARRVATVVARSTTGSFASAGSLDEPLAAVPMAAATVAAAAAAGASTAAVAGARTGSGLIGTGSAGGRTLMVAPLAAAAAGVAALSSASVGSTDSGEDLDPGAEVVAEGLRRFFSSLVINLQGIEMRNPVLLVQLPGPGAGAASGAALPRAAGSAQSPPWPGRTAATPASLAGSGLGTVEGGALLPALLTITMKVAILQLPPLNMKF